MEESFKYGSCLLYRTPVWVHLPSDSEVAILIKPLSHQDISSSQELQYVSSKSDKYFKYETMRNTLIPTVVDYTNILGFPNVSSIVSQLSNDDVLYLYERLIELSTFSRTQLDALNDMLEIQFNSQFQDDSWDCTMCQEKKLDYARGCGFLEEDKRDPAPMLPKVNGRRFKTCPISTLDGYVASQASMAHTLFTSGVLPEPGGLGEQTEWFVRAALLYKRKVAEAERAAYEDRKK